jgi:Protein of unknown function (DUF2827)
MASKYNVGVTISVEPDGEFAFYNNGLRQNVVFLYKLFQASKNCNKVWLINCSDGVPKNFPVELNITPGDVVRLDEVTDKLDFLITLGSSPDAPSLKRLRDRGAKTIKYKAGNAAVISMESCISNEPDKDAERYFDNDCYDSIWMTTQHIHTYKAWCQTMYRVDVEEIPQIWDDSFFHIQRPEIKARFGFKTKDKWRVGVMDPNITVMKTSHLPAMVCEAAYNINPDYFEAIFLTNAIQFQGNKHFNSFLTNMSCVKNKIMTIEPRFLSWDFIANHSDAIVTHHWENGLNYIYYEVMYGGYPLIHNSEFLKDYGYYYDSFDAQSGGRALISAIESHADNIELYKSKVEVLLNSLSPVSANNIKLHEDLMIKL